MVFRPVETPHSYPLRPGLAVVNGRTRFKCDAEVPARHVAGTPFSKVGARDQEEYWHSHGCYFNDQGKIMPSEELWNPIDQG